MEACSSEFWREDTHFMIFLCEIVFCHLLCKSRDLNKQEGQVASVFVCDDAQLLITW